MVEMYWHYTDPINAISAFTCFYDTVSLTSNTSTSIRDKSIKTKNDRKKLKHFFLKEYIRKPMTLG